MIQLLVWIFLTFLQTPPDFSGTWRLDASQSRVADGAGMLGLIQVSAPQTLHITQPANGTLIIESQINESHSRIYKPGVKMSTPFWGGAISMVSRWEGRSLIGEGAQESASGGASTPVKETITLSPDGRTLTIEITTTNSSTYVYTRIQDVGPCKTWPTPCKTFQ
ncbi:MAG: hypothetical protein HY646_15910 [Acidobacteria bacterium]|nr:hypothetical protein [Acidobacteriota bacterium]